MLLQMFLIFDLSYFSIFFCEKKLNQYKYKQDTIAQVSRSVSIDFDSIYLFFFINIDVDGDSKLDGKLEDRFILNLFTQISHTFVLVLSLLLL